MNSPLSSQVMLSFIVIPYSIGQSIVYITLQIGTKYFASKHIVAAAGDFRAAAFKANDHPMGYGRYRAVCCFHLDPPLTSESPLPATAHELH